MNVILRLAGLIALAALLLWQGAPTLAQEASPASGAESVATLEGMQEAIGRQYSADPEAPEASPASKHASAGVLFVTARIVAFDTSEHAATAYAGTIADAADQVDALGIADAQITAEDIAEVGDEAHAVSMTSTGSGGTGSIRLLFILDGERLYVLTAIAGSEEGATITDAIGQAMLEREPGNDAPRFDPDGTSTGGLWAIFPETDDPVLDGLVASADQQLASPGN